jgi:predicted DNA-binding transcriptional regulator YafY
MQQASRQNHILEILRRHRQPTTAAFFADALGVTIRTIYRDIASMMADNVPIISETGVGYVLEAGYDLPPLMFSVEELEALMLGADMVQKRGDDALVQAAQRAMAKIAFALPSKLKDQANNMALQVVPVPILAPDVIDLVDIRTALRKERKIRIAYRDESGTLTQRIIWPVVLGYFEQKRVLVAWCETRSAFRHFRSDRIQSVMLMPEDMPHKRKTLERSWRDDMNSLRKSSEPETSNPTQPTNAEPAS